MLRVPVHVTVQPYMDVLKLALPYAPSVNRIWRRGKHATYKDKKAVDFNAAVLAERYRLVPDATTIFPAGVQVDVDVVMHPKRTKVVARKPDTYDPLTVQRTDLDAPLKVLFDSMQHAGIFENDKQIVKIAVELGAPMDGGGLTVVARGVSP